MIDEIKSIIGWKKYKEGNRVIIYYDMEWRVFTWNVSMIWDPKKDKQSIKKLNAYKLVKEINVRDLWKVMAKFRVTNAFLLHFFEIMEQQEEDIWWKVIFDIPKIFERLQTQDIEYFEFYKFVLIEINRWKLIWEVIREISWFENYVEFFDMLDSLKEEDKAKLFSKLKEKILKEQSIKKQLTGPIKQPIAMLAIILSIFVWFSWSMIKDILVQFEYLWYTDKTPWIIIFIYNLWHFVSTNGSLLLFYIFTLSLMVLWIMQIKEVKAFFQKLMFDVPFYQYFNEMFMGYMILLQANNEKKWLKDVFYDLRQSYKDNKYYHFVFDLIYTKINVAAENYIPYRKYGYILSNEFISSLEQIIKQNKLALIKWYLRFVDWKMDQLLKKFAATLSTLWVAIVATWILILFLWIFLWNNAKSDLLKMEAKWNFFEADVKFNLVDKSKMNNIIDEYKHR